MSFAFAFSDATITMLEDMGDVFCNSDKTRIYCHLWYNPNAFLCYQQYVNQPGLYQFKGRTRHAETAHTWATDTLSQEMDEAMSRPVKTWLEHGRHSQS